MYTYLLINLLSIAIPFAYSFTAHSGFSRRFARAWSGILLVAIPMIAWDAWFTARGIWSFNPEYHLGLKVFGLPLEEMLFFLCIPFACLFIYDTVTKFPRLALPERPVRIVAGVAGVALLALALYHHERAYTFWCFLLASPFALALAAGAFRERAGFIASTYLFHLIPFFLVNGLLTGLPVVMYNDAENLGIRLGTIPLEDAVYSLILLFGTIFWLERERGQRRSDTPAPSGRGATRPSQPT